MTAIAAHACFARMNWPRIGALSGSMSMHLCVLILLFLPPIAIKLLQRPVSEPIMVQVIPEIVRTEPVLPTPAHHDVHPHVTPHSEAIRPAFVKIPLESAIQMAAVDPIAPEPITTSPLTTSAPSVDVAPSAIAYGTRTRVAYPREAQLRGEHGTVILRVLVGTDGLPQIVEIQTSSGSPRLDNAARDAVKHWSFLPGTRDGVSHSAWARVPIAFDLTQL